MNFRSIGLAAIGLCASVVAQAANWTESDTTFYAVSNDASEIIHFDKATGPSRTTSLPQVNSVGVNSNDLFAATAGALYAYSLSDFQRRHIGNLSTPIVDMTASDNYVWVITKATGYSNNTSLKTYDAQTGDVVSEFNLSYTSSIDGLQYIASANRLFVNVDGSLKYINLNSDGSPKTGLVKVYSNGTYVGAPVAYSHEKSIALTDTGHIVDTKTLNAHYAAEFNGILATQTLPMGYALVYANEIRIIDKFFNSVVAFEGAYSNVAGTTMNGNVLSVFSSTGTQVTQDLGTYATQPATLPQTSIGIDQFSFDENSGLAYVYNALSSQILIHNAQSDSYQSLISLPKRIIQQAVDTTNSRLYLVHGDGEIAYLDLADNSYHLLGSAKIQLNQYSNGPVPTGALLNGAVLDIVAVASGVVVATDAGLYAFDTTGNQTSYLAVDDIASKLTYSQVNQSLYWVDRYYSSYSSNLVQQAKINDQGALTLKPGHDARTSTYAIEAPVILSDLEDKLVLGSGIIVDTLNRQELNTLANPIEHGAWHAKALATTQSKTLQFWQGDTYELVASQSLDGSVLSLHTWQDGIVAYTNSEAGIASHYFDMNADSDGDTVEDLFDNCAQISNVDQADYDADLIGDVCDSDIDNDGLSNAFEDQYGFDNYNAIDAKQDLDEDGFNNVLEFKYGTNPNDANDFPAAITSLLVDFESNALEYDITGNSVRLSSELAALGDQSIKSTGDVPSLTFSEYLSAGYLSFYTFGSTYGLTVKINDEAQTKPYGSMGQWTFWQLVIPAEGEYKISLTETQQNALQLDHIRFSTSEMVDARYDLDNDGILSSDDNCPLVANASQSDVDNDGLGNACDNDSDNDWMFDSEEVLHGFNTLDSVDAFDDADNDGASNRAEVRFGFDPLDGESTPSYGSGVLTEFTNNELPSWIHLGPQASATIEEGIATITAPSDAKILVDIFAFMADSSRISVEVKYEGGERLRYSTTTYDYDYLSYDLYSGAGWQTVTLQTSEGLNRLRFGRNYTGNQAMTLQIRKISIIEADDDNDSIPNSQDNCLNDSNVAQADLDNDGLGDVCDEDRDGDGLSNYIEELNGMDADDATDGLADNDNDGTTNADEIRIGTDPNDASSKAIALINTAQSLAGQVVQSDHPWRIGSFDGRSELLQSGIIGDNQTSSFTIVNNFQGGELVFECMVDGEAGPDKLIIYVDDDFYAECSSDYWQSMSITLPETASEIRFSYEKDGSVSTGTDSAYIDSIMLICPDGNCTSTIGVPTTPSTPDDSVTPDGSSGSKVSMSNSKSGSFGYMGFGLLALVAVTRRPKSNHKRT